MKIKKILSCLLVLAVLSTVFFAPPTAKAEIINGTYEEFNWTFNSDTGELTVTGVGEMPNFSDTDLYSQPWADYIDQITSVVIGEGIEIVGWNNFYNHYNLKSVTFPSTLYTLFPYSFANCTSLTSVVLPAVDGGYFNVSDNAFSNCTSLKTIVAEGSLDLHTTAVNYCSSLESIVVKGDKMYIDSSDAFGSPFNGTSSSLTISAKATNPNAQSICETYGFGYKALCADATSNHNYVATNSATCTQGGTNTYTCSRCNHSYVGEATNPLGHDYETNVVPANCTTKGYTEYTCSVCGDFYVDDYTALTEHQVRWKIKYPATTQSTGLEESYCTVCNLTLATREIPVLDEEAVVETVQPDGTIVTYYKGLRVVAGMGCAKIAIEQDKNIDGYQVFVSSDNANFKQIDDIKTKGDNYLVIKNLQSDTNYFVKMIGYKEVDGKTLYAEESRPFAVRIK